MAAGRFAGAARAAALLVALLLPAALAGQAGTHRQQYVGSQVCKGCHPNLSERFTGNPHFKSIALGRESPERTGCEGCHGPGGLHATSADPDSIVRFPQLVPRNAQDRCLGCHAEDFGKLHVRRSAHLTGDIGCTTCHSIHGSHGGSPLLAGQQRDVCYSCHQQVRARFDLPFKHRVNEGAMECTDCHNPHGAPLVTWGAAHRPRMVSQALGNDLPCAGCHPDTTGPFLHEHPPVRVEGCGSCHDPHGSSNPRLLNRPAAFTLCLECHGDVVGFGTRGTGIPAPERSFHNLAEPAMRECVLCHARIHGSNADPLFRR